MVGRRRMKSTTAILYEKQAMRVLCMGSEERARLERALKKEVLAWWSWSSSQ